MPLNHQRIADDAWTPSRGAILLVVALAALAAGIVALACTPNGPSGWHFAMNNIEAAENLLEGRGAYQSGGEPFLSWPPLLVVLLAGGKLAGLRYVTACTLIAVLATFATVYAHGRLLLEFSRRAWIAAGGIAVVVVSPYFVPMMASTRSQPLFMALAALSVWWLVQWVRAPARRLEFALAAGGLLACLHRYDGLVLAAVIAGVVCCARTELAFSRRLRTALAIGAAAVLPLAAWMLRNRAVSGTFSGARLPAELTLGDQIRDVARTAALWLVPGPANPLTQALAAALVALLALWVARRCSRTTRWRALALVSFPALYAAALMLLAASVELDVLGERLAVPSMTYLVTLAVLALADETLWPPRAARVLATALPAAYVLAHLAFHAPTLVANCDPERTRAAGDFAVARWIDPDFGRWLREHPLPERLLSNAPAAVLLGADRVAQPVDPEAWREALATLDEPAVLVWQLRKREAKDVEQMRAEFALEPLATFESWHIYRVQPRR